MEPQCQFFVLRKKRLCRMTVKPGRQYCGEHDPEPKNREGQTDSRIPCPNDPKHTCYISKLEKHLSICNARPTDQPSYIVHNINAPTDIETSQRKPLCEISKSALTQVIDKVNFLYGKHIENNIECLSELPIHPSVMEEFSQDDRTESSLRHLRQASRLLWLMEEEHLVQDKTCYVELGAGKGQLSYFACTAWCDADRGSSALLVDRASLRHKRDNKVRERGALRLRADLAHLNLEQVPIVQQSEAVVGLAKHLCGVATDFALRCITRGVKDGQTCRTKGVVLATCCHHRCERMAYVANPQLQDLGINEEEFNIMLGIVSWATCGDGRSRDKKIKDQENNTNIKSKGNTGTVDESELKDGKNERLERIDTSKGVRDLNNDAQNKRDNNTTNKIDKTTLNYNRLDPADVQALEDCDKNYKQKNLEDNNVINEIDNRTKEGRLNLSGVVDSQKVITNRQLQFEDEIAKANDEGNITHGLTDKKENNEKLNGDFKSLNEYDRTEIREPDTAVGEKCPEGRLVLSQQYREEVGRKAKALLDWGRVLYLRGLGFDARLCYYVPHTVSLENVCIVARKQEC